MISVDRLMLLTIALCIILASLVLMAGCSQPSVYDLPPSLMDAGQGPYKATVTPAAPPAKPKPVVKPQAAVTPTPFIGVRPVRVDAEDQVLAQAIALTLFHELHRAGVKIKADSDWTIVGTVTGNGVLWTIRSPDGIKGVVHQTGLTTGDVLAVSPGIKSYLPATANL